MAALFLLIGSLVAAQATDADGADPAERVPQLVKQLGGDELASREAAEKSLLELGPDALAFLPIVDDSTAAELRERLGRVREQLERQRSEAFLAPSTVTLRAGSGMLLSRVLEQVQDQTGNSLVDVRGDQGQDVTDPRIKLTLDNVPFWQALDQILDSALLSVDPTLSDQAVALVARMEGTERTKRASYSGPFRFQPGTITAQRDLRSSTHTMRIEYEVAWEPRLLPVAIYQASSDLKATDEAGNSIAVADDGQQLEIPVSPGMTTTELPVLLTPPARKIEKLASLQGKLTALIPGGIETFRFAKVDAGKVEDVRKGAVIVGVDELKRNNDLWELRMHVRFDNAQGALESYRGWVYNNEAFLEDPDGNAIPPVGSETTAQSEGEVGMVYLFDLDQEPKRFAFVYRSPVVIVRVPVTFELKDLDLP